MTSNSQSFTQLFVVRHAHAGDRARFVGDDALRPLSTKGVWQAQEIVNELLQFAPLQIFSSPAVRCVMTVTPLAIVCVAEVTELDVLKEGSDPKGAFVELLDITSSSNEALIACSHGDVIGGIVELLLAREVAVIGAPGIKKASIVELRVAGGSVETMRFIPPPNRV